MRYIFSWQHYSLQRWWALKNLLMEFAVILMSLASWTRRCSGYDFLKVYCIHWACRTDKKGTRELCQIEKGRIALQCSCSTKETARHLAGHRRKWVTNCQCRQNRSSNVLLPWIDGQILWAYRLCIEAPTLQKNFGWLSRQWDVSVISRTLEVVIIYFLFKVKSLV